MRSKLLFWNAKAGYYRKWSRWFRFVDSSFVTKSLILKIIQATKRDISQITCWNWILNTSLESLY